MGSFAGLLLAPLPEHKAPWKSFVGSLGAQAVAVIALCLVGMLATPNFVLPQQYSVTELVSAPPVEDYVPRQPERVIPRVKPPEVMTAELETPKIELRVPTPVQPKPKPVEAPAPVFASQTAPQIIAPKAPAVVHTGSFGSEGSSAQATVKLPPQQVQTGGFGDPNGLRGEGTSNRPHLVAARMGSFDLPAGPGYGNGTGGARGVRGTVASTGFGNGTATRSAAAAPAGAVQQGGFGDAHPVVAERHVARAVTTGATTPVEILSKPTPVYTDEARKLKIEGEVLLEARFGANGQLQVLRVVRGLGYGLDEAAIRAAQQIRFRPAKQDGEAVDSVASLHVLFQLAY